MRHGRKRRFLTPPHMCVSVHCNRRQRRRRRRISSAFEVIKKATPPSLTRKTCSHLLYAFAHALTTFFINNDITKCTLDVVYKGLGGAEKKFPKQGLRCVTGELVSLFKKYRPWRDDGSSGEEHDGIAGVPSLPRPRPSFVLEFPQNQRPILVADISLEASFLPLRFFPRFPLPFTPHPYYGHPCASLSLLHFFCHRRQPTGRDFPRVKCKLY